MEIEHCTPHDYSQILSQIADFWGSERTLPFHHPLFVHEFGNSAFCIKAGPEVAAYLFGLIAQTAPTAYIHLVGVRPAYRRHGLARQLYEHFIGFARAHDCTLLKAITTPQNSTSIAFHRALGMRLLGTPNEHGVPVVANYAGPGQDRVVFHLGLDREEKRRL
jgi:GNAT superfamily N-acetyltransferase